VTTEAQLSAAIATNAYIVLANSITLDAGKGGTASAFTISGVTGLTIDGNGYTLGFASSSNTNGRIFYIYGASGVEVVNLTLTNGYAYTTSGNYDGGAIYLDGGSTLEMVSCVLSGHIVKGGSGTAASYGGAISVRSASTLNLTDCTLLANTAEVAKYGNGGAIHADSSTLTLTSCTFSENKAKASRGSAGGAIYVYHAVSSLLTSCTFSENTATTTCAISSCWGYAGAVYTYNGPMSLSDCSFNLNTAYNMGHDIFMDEVSGSGNGIVGCAGCEFTSKSDSIHDVYIYSGTFTATGDCPAGAVGVQGGALSTNLAQTYYSYAC